MTGFINKIAGINAKYLIAFIIILNFLAKILLLAVMGPGSPPVDDGVDYYEIAKNLAGSLEFSGVFGITSARAPMYPFFLGLLFALSGGNITAIRILQILLSLLIFPLLYRFLKKIGTGKQVAITALGLYALYPAFIYLPYRLLTENLFILLLMLFSLVFIRYRNIKDCIFCGVLSGLLALTRPMFLLYPFFSLVYLFFHREKSLRRTVRDFSIISVFMLVTIMPWTIRNYKLWGGFCLITTNSGNTIMINNNDFLFDIKGPAPQNRVFRMEKLHPDFMPGTELWESMNELERDRELQKRTFDWIRNNPVSFIRLIPVKLWSFWHYSQNPQTPEIKKSVQDIGSALSYLVLLPFMFYGFLISFRFMRFPDQLYPVSLLALFLCTTIIFGGSLRFRLPFDLFLIIWASMGISHISSILGGIFLGKFRRE